MTTTVDYPISVPFAYNAGETKIYKQVIGPRGGIRWVCVNTIYASGVYFPNAQFEPGIYKMTQWANGWPRIINEFEVIAD